MKKASFLAIFFLCIQATISQSIATPSTIVDDNFYCLTQEEQDAAVTDLLLLRPHFFSTATPWLQEHDSAWRMLDIDLLIAKLNRTITTIGKKRFKELMKPIGDVAELEQRRVVFKWILQQQGLCSDIEQILTHCHDQEVLLLSLFDKRNSFNELLKENATFWQGYTTNTTPLAGSVLRYRQILNPILTTIGAAFYFMVFPIGYIYDALYYGADIAAGAVGSVITGVTSYGMVTSWQEALCINEHMRTMHALVINVAMMIKNIEVCERLMPKECIQVHRAIARWKEMLDEKSSEYSQDLALLVVLLQSSTFTGNPSANVGTSFKELINAYEYIIRVKDRLATLLCIYGEMDAYMSVVRLYKEFEQNKTTISWVNFSEESSPYSNFDDMYNPLISFDNAVYNSFVFGGSTTLSGAARHMLLTGPHGCGKTTVMRSYAYAYIMGQSILLVPARQATISPLTHLSVYLNITDNLAAGVSSFMAEQNHMEILRKTAFSLASNDRCLMLIDEPFAKTLPSVGERRVYNFMHEVKEISQLMIIIASHFEKPALLENETNGLVKNYYPELLEPKAGTFLRTFKILEGTASWWFEDVDRRERFIEWLGAVTA